MKKLLVKISIWTLFLGPVFAVFLFVCLFEAKYSDRFYPGVFVAGKSVEEETYAEVFNGFQAKADLISKNGLEVDVKGKNGTDKIKIPAFFNGFTIDKVVEYYSLGDWQSEIQKAYNVGRQGDIWQKIKEQFKSYREGVKFVFLPSVQEDSVESYVNNELSGFLVKSSPAHFLYSYGKVSIMPEVVGEKINAQDMADSISQKLATLDNSSYDLKVAEDVPPVGQKSLEPFLNSAEQIGNSASIVFHYNDYSWNVNGGTLVSWLSVNQDNKLVVDEKSLENYFDKNISPYIDSPMQNSRFTVENNKLVEIIAGVAGNVADIKKAAEEIEKNISGYVNSPQSQNFTIDIPVEVVKEEPKITKETISKYDIKDLVGTATTDFAGGSLDRQHNIEVGVSKLNGMLLAPGQEFSGVYGIGDITEEAGFVKEYVISGGKTQKELGGGLCQLATTLFRMALNGGLPITERVNHRYVISYYGAGLDATIYGPHPDIRFVNDTGNYLLLQGKAENNKVTFEIYGRKDGRTVAISDPVLSNRTSPPPTKMVETATLPTGKIKCTEIPHNGVTADVTYTVKYPDGQAKEINFHSVYQPWQKVCLIGM